MAELQKKVFSKFFGTLDFLLFRKVLKVGSKIKKFKNPALLHKNTGIFLTRTYLTSFPLFTAKAVEVAPPAHRLV